MCPLIHVPNGIYSVVSKCNNDEFHFNAPEKFEHYLRHLLSCKQTLGFQLYDICCMSNHVHEMYVVPEHITIADILKRVKGQFSQQYNRRHGRTGHFWRNKPFYRLVQNERYVMNCCIYYYYNPVKAGLVRDPAEWPYSGYRFHVLGDRSGLLGALLDPIPEISEAQWLQPDPVQVEKVSVLLQRRGSIGIGDETFQMRLSARRKAI